MVSSSMLLTGLIVLAVGAIGVKFSHKIARFSEQMDAIGSTTPMNEVEPAGWKWLLTILCFAAVGLFGVAMVVMSILQP